MSIWSKGIQNIGAVMIKAIGKPMHISNSIQFLSRPSLSDHMNGMFFIQSILHRNVYIKWLTTRNI